MPNPSTSPPNPVMDNKTSRYHVCTPNHSPRPLTGNERQPNMVASCAPCCPVLCCLVVCCAVLCCDLLCYAMLFSPLLCYALLSSVVLSYGVLCCAVLCCIALWFAVSCSVVFFYIVLRCAVFCFTLPIDSEKLVTGDDCKFTTCSERSLNTLEFRVTL